MASLDFLDAHFSKELYISAKQMAVFSLLPNLAPALANMENAEELKRKIHNADASNQAYLAEENAKIDKIILELGEEKNNYQKAAAAKDGKDKSGRTMSEIQDSCDAKKLKLKYINENISQYDLHTLKMSNEEFARKYEMLTKLLSFIKTPEQKNFYRNWAHHLDNYLVLNGVEPEGLGSREQGLGSSFANADAEKLQSIKDTMLQNFELSHKSTLAAKNKQATYTQTMQNYGKTIYSGTRDAVNTSVRSVFKGVKTMGSWLPFAK